MAVVDINALTIAQSPEDNAGKKKMIYKSDSTVGYVVNIDENIGNSMGFDDYTDTSSEKSIPVGMVMRSVSFSDVTGKVKGAYPCGKPDTPIFLNGGTIKVPRKGSILGVVCGVSSRKGEKSPLLNAADTGQTDGSIT